MAGWISSKLKVAENLLQQIDNQAAESLRHGERKASDELDLPSSSTPKLSTGVSLKDQLKKKKDSPKSIESFGKLAGDSSGKKVAIDLVRKDVSGKQKGESDLKLPSSINDGDWTELLSPPDLSPIAHSSGGSSRSGVRRGGRNVGRGRKHGDGNGGQAKIIVGVGKSDENGSRKPVSTSEVLGGNRDREMKKLEIVGDSGNVTPIVVNREQGHESDGIFTRGELVNSEDNLDQSSNKGNTGDFDEEYSGKATKRMSNHNLDVAEYVSKALKGNSHMEMDRESDSDSDSDSGSDSSSDSNSKVEREREREERRQKRREILAAKAAAKVTEAIKEQENVVARLEGEYQSLEKILEERTKQVDEEASKLQSTMIETMEAADLEKQKHNHTRMEFLARLAKLETANADLAKSLANAQWNLEMEVNNITKLRRQVDAKELVHEELKRQIHNTHKKRTSRTNHMPYKGFELEREMLEGEFSLITEKIAPLQEKAKKLEGDIEVLLKESESPTEIEVELKRRLRQMTDHLIQKQAQVEALSSEKATLLFRTEAVSRLLDENNSLTNGDYTSSISIQDLGAAFESASPRLQTLQRNIQSGKQHLGSIVRQLDAIFYAGSLFLARNPAAKLWSLIYLVCLHLWVLYILFSKSQSTENSISSSTVSLENINNSIGV